MGNWKHSIFNCCAPGFCGFYKASKCFPCVYAENVEKSGAAGYWTACLGACLLPELGFLWFSAKAREAVREQKGIDGSFVGDCCAVIFCPFCSHTQMMAELDANCMGEDKEEENVVVSQPRKM